MKNQISYILLIILMAVSCKNATKTTSDQLAVTVADNTQNQEFVITDTDLETAVIYEANIRQYSPEGTFNAFTNDIPKLKKLGVKIIWLMPIYPISTTKSKGTLGSYYAVSDYTKINPEFGTLEDFQKLVNVAHEHKMFVVLDWVANHTGWDHVWLKEHPEYYTKDSLGQITHTVDTDWTDVADLNYDNQEMRAQMQEDMLYWLKEQNVDGFRCDVAGMVPTDFWETTVAALKKEKPIFMLAEGWEPELLDKAFDMGYSWDTHHRMNDIAKGEKTVAALDKRLAKIDSLYQKDDILMNFVTNHDENSWNGTIKERMGAAAAIMTALSYTLPGMPLIYSGQEYDMDKRLRFFEKDTILKTKGGTWELLEKLGKLKSTHPALHGGKNKASFKRIAMNDPNVFAFERAKEGKRLLFIGNLSAKPTYYDVDIKGDFINAFTGAKQILKKGKGVELAAWSYQIYISK